MCNSRHYAVMDSNTQNKSGILRLWFHSTGKKKKKVYVDFSANILLACMFCLFVWLVCFLHLPWYLPIKRPHKEFRYVSSNKFYYIDQKYWSLLLIFNKISNLKTEFRWSLKRKDSYFLLISLSKKNEERKKPTL